MIYGNYLREKYNNTAVKLADAEGVPCVMEYSKGKNLRNYEIYGNSVQDGTPSPDTPIEVQSVGDYTIKNLLPYPYYDTTKTINGITFTDNGDGSITIDGTATANAVFYLVGKQDNYTLDKCGLKIGDKYTISKTLISGDSIANVYFMGNYYNTSDSMKQGAIATSDNTATSTIQSDFKSWGIYLLVVKDKTVNNTTIKLQLEKGSSATEYELYHKYDIPITVRGKNLLPNSDWMSGAHQNGFQEQVTKEYITEYTQNSVSFNLSAWTGVSSPRFQKDSVKRIVFKINQNQINSDDGYINFYVVIQGYDNDNNKIGNLNIYDNAVANTEYVFDFSRISSHSFYANSTQFSFCILARKNALSNFMVYDIAYYAETDTTEYEPYVKPTITHIYLNEPLRKVGDYADYIDFKNQKVVRNILKQSLNAYVIYKKLNNVIRISCWLGRDIKHKYDSHILSTIFNYKLGWSEDIEIIFHHTDNYYNFYWSVYWSRLGLAYDGTNVYRIDDTEQTPLTDTEIISIANEWLSTLSDKDKEIYVILDTPTEEPISLPTLKTVKGTSIMSVNTSIQPSNIKTKYVKL